MPEDGSLDRKDFDADGAARSDSGVRSDYFVERDGLVFAGSHLLADFWGVSGIDDIARVEAALREAVEACGATLLTFRDPTTRLGSAPSNATIKSGIELRRTGQ